MDNIAGEFPDLARRLKIGHSFENRSMYVLKVRPHAIQRACLDSDSWFLVSRTPPSHLSRRQLFRTSLTSARRVRWGDILPGLNLV